MLAGKRILLIIGGGIAAYKSLDLIRELRRAGAAVTPVLTKSAEEFVTPLSTSALAASKVYRELFDLTDEAEMGHIELSRSADLIVVAPATADLMAKMAQGLANDLASTLLLATDTDVMLAPAMNVRMWEHPATQRNLKTLLRDGVLTVGPDEGEMACGEFGPGRMATPIAIVDAVSEHFGPRPLAGKHVIVTSGPTHEPIDPVRYIANRSSGAQGTALATALRDLGANVSFVTGPASQAYLSLRSKRRRKCWTLFLPLSRRMRQFLPLLLLTGVSPLPQIAKLRRTARVPCRSWSLPKTLTFWRQYQDDPMADLSWW